MSNDLSSGSLLSLAKERYIDGKLEETIYKQSPFFAKVTKKGGEFIGGKYLVNPVRTTHSNAAGAHLGNAVTAASGSNASEMAVAFQVPRAKLWNPFIIDGDLLRAVKGGDTGFITSLTDVMDGALKVLSNRVCRSLYRSGYGEIGTILTGSISAATFQFTNAEDIYGVEIGDRICFSASLNSNTLRNTGGTTSLTVIKVDHAGNKVTCSANISTITGTTNGDYVFFVDSRQDSATPAVVETAGIPLWVPDVLSTSTSVMGVNLSTAGDRAQGQNFDASNMPIEEGITKALAQFHRVAPTSEIDSLFVNDTKWAELVIALGTRARYVEESGGDIAVNFTGIKFTAPSGPVTVYADPYCPVARGYALTSSAWVLGHTSDKPVVLWDEDGLQVQRITTGADIAEMGLFEFRGNLACKAPFHNGVIKFS